MFGLLSSRQWYAFIRPSFVLSIFWYIQIGSATCRLIGMPKFAAFLPHRIHARVVGMHSRRFGLARHQSAPLVVDFTHAARTRLVAALQFLHGRGPNPGLL